MARKRPSAAVAVAPPEPARRMPLLPVALVLLCLAGAAAAGYLSLVHFGVLFGNLSYGAVCGGPGGGDCNSVVASRFGMFAGLPVSIWGLAYYLVAGVLALGLAMLRVEDTPPLARALAWLTIAALAADAYLGWAIFARLGRPCWLCLATYAINLAILVLVHVRRRRVRGDDRWTTLPPGLGVLARPADPAYYRDLVKALLGAAAVIGCAAAVAITVVSDGAAAKIEQTRLERLIDFVRTGQPVAVPTAGRPSRGPEDAKVTVVVFSDFLCQQCRRANEYLDIVASNHRDDLRIVYRELPSDVDCNPGATSSGHPGACRLALGAECAYRQERFWPFHDRVFAGTAKIDPDRVETYARQAGLDMDRFRSCESDSGPAMAAVRADIEVAHRLGVEATPTFFINGLTVVGALKPWMLERAIDAIEAGPGAPSSSR